MGLLGVLFAVFPVAGIATLGLIVGALLFAHGIGSVMLAFRLKPRQGWGWVLFDGILSIVMALHDRDRLAGRARSPFVGMLVGIALIYAGIWRIMLARALRDAPAAAPRSRRRRARSARGLALRAQRVERRVHRERLRIELDVQQRRACRCASARSKAGANSSVRATVSPCAP